MILVTGGAGFIGSNLVAALAAQTSERIAVCDTFGTEEKWKNLAKHRIAEVVPPESVISWLNSKRGQVHTIFHMGAISATTEADVDLILKTNLTLSQALWTWATEEEAQFIYASSAATYGDGSLGFDDDSSITALSALRPLNAYGWSKQLFDIHAARSAMEGRAPRQWAGLKFFNVYGPNEAHKGGMRSVVHQTFGKVQETGRATLFRSHNPAYEDGGQLRDFVWVGDCVDQMLWLHKNQKVSGIFNAGSGKARSFLDLARAVFAAMNLPEAIDWVDTPVAIRKHYQYFTEAKMDRIAQAGYVPQGTTLEQGVETYLRTYLMTDDPYR